MPILVPGESPYLLLVVCTFLSFIFELPSVHFLLFFSLFLFMSLLYHAFFICQYIFRNIFKFSILFFFDYFLSIKTNLLLEFSDILNL